MNNFPSADAVNGNLMTAAESLLMHGWQLPSILTARLALDRHLRFLVQVGGLEDEVPRGAGGLSHQLKCNDLIGEQLHRGTVKLNRELNSVVHGEEVSLLEAVRLVELTQQRLEDFRSLSSCATYSSPSPVALRGGWALSTKENHGKS